MGKNTNLEFKLQAQYTYVDSNVAKPYSLLPCVA